MKAQSWKTASKNNYKSSSNKSAASTARSRVKAKSKSQTTNKDKKLYRKSTNTPFSFPGKIKNSTRYRDGTKGLFIKEVKGQKGKFFIEKGMRTAVDVYLGM